MKWNELVNLDPIARRGIMVDYSSSLSLLRSTSNTQLK